MFERSLNVTEALAYFLYINVEFFSVPFLHNEDFQVWAKANEAGLLRLSTDLKKTLKPTDIINFADALCGKVFEPNDDKKSLIHGDPNRLIQFLKVTPSMIKMLIRHLNNPIIDQWYQENANKDVIIARLSKSKMREKIQIIVKRYREEMSSARVNTTPSDLLKIINAKVIQLNKKLKDPAVSEDNKRNIRLKIACFELLMQRMSTAKNLAFKEIINQWLDDTNHKILLDKNAKPRPVSFIVDAHKNTFSSFFIPTSTREYIERLTNAYGNIIFNGTLIPLRKRI